ncbi:kinase-like domain-containing protein [Lasiosphaeria ovina]|uniref:Kinase-like domain-containing protein n=1 Tax=Lasiosphaeria ovina TaxID=92902 RepID=A0AAE0NA01_9PEZI|nr:kinase-like domain-containing protein [Lasiosphaeria ovina]
MPRFLPIDYEAHLFDIHAESDLAREAFEAKLTKQATTDQPRVKTGDNGERCIQVYPTIAEYKNKKRAGRLVTFGNVKDGDTSRVDIPIEKEFPGYESYLYLDPDTGSLFLHVLKGNAKVSVSGSEDPETVREQGIPGAQICIPDTAESVTIEMGAKGYKFRIHWERRHRAKESSHPRSLEIRSFLGRQWERHPDELGSQDQKSPWILGRYGDLKPLAPKDEPQKPIKLGEGAFATVYRRVVNPGKRTFAVKEPGNLELDNRNTRPVVESLKNELSWLKKLRHENIIRLIRYTAVVVKAGRPPILTALAFRELRDLSELKWDYHKIDVNGGRYCTRPALEKRPEWLGDLVIDVLSALQDMTDHKVVHRDIKENNIMFEEVHAPMDRPKDGKKYLFQLIDFGHATDRENSDARIGYGRNKLFEAAEPSEEELKHTHPGVDLSELAPLLLELSGIMCHDEDETLNNGGWKKKAESLGAVIFSYRETLLDPKDIEKQYERKLDDKLRQRYLKQARGLLDHKNAKNQSILPPGYQDLYDAANPKSTTTAGDILKKFIANHDYLLFPKPEPSSATAAVTKQISALGITPESSKH